MSNPSARPILLLCLAVGLTSLGGLQAQADPSAKAADPAAQDAGASDAPIPEPAAPAQSASATEPSPEQIAALLATARVLKAERSALFDGAEGVLATLVLPDGQGAAADIRPGDVLIRYGETPLDSAQQLVALTGETPPEQAVTLRWLRPGAEGQAEALEASIRGGRIGVGIRDLAETPEERIQAVLNGGAVAMQDARYDEAERLFRQGLDLAIAAGSIEWRGRSLMLLGMLLAHQGRDPEALERCDQALAALREIDAPALEARVLNVCGIFYGKLGRYAEALESLSEALAIYRELGERQDEARVSLLLEAIYESLGRTAEAQEAREARTRALARGIGDPTLRARTPPRLRIRPPRSRYRPSPPASRSKPGSPPHGR